MSFDKYVHHIAQKYRLAVAISVIKTKPDNLSIEDYLVELQNKIKDTEIDPNETVCSDDFNFDDATPYENSQPNMHTDRSKCDMTNETLLHFRNENDSQCSQTILNDFVFGDAREPNVQRKGDLEDTIMLLKEVTADIQEKPDTNQNLSQLTFCESQEEEDINNTNIDITYCSSNTLNPHNVTEINEMHIQNCSENNMDSQETELYTLQGFTQNYTHVSQTQGDYFIMADKYIRNKGNGNIQDNLEDMDQQNEDTPMIYNAKQNVLTQNEFAIANNEIDRHSMYTVQHKVNVDNAFDNTQLFHSQDVRVTKEFADKYIFTVLKGDENIRKVTKNVEYVENSNLAQTFEFNIHRSAGELTNNSKATLTKEKDICKDRRILTETNIKDVQNTDFGNETPFISIDSQNTPKESTDANIKKDTIDIRHKDNSMQYRKYILEPDKSINNNQNIANDQQSAQVKNIENEYEMDVDETDSDEHLPERVPFKVLEELNRVKSFLNRKDRRNNDGGYSTDSGYRSDSKSRSLKSCSQLSGMTGNWLNQSAHCLFNHITQTTGTDDIVKEIAQVLGQLIDKLHEEENYPPFLEELLETVDHMLSETRGGGWAENVLITKDENIQRLILLNKSKHILQYTIDKITTILEDLHTNLTQENLYELTNILEVENACYIFHLLEIFLKRYTKVKDISSQSTQNSQEDSFPKRSSLTELWRKKWNPNCKEVVKNENRTCILKRCSEILNKIIVECMDGYSLVAFAALQCFNLIQV